MCRREKNENSPLAKKVINAKIISLKALATFYIKGTYLAFIHSITLGDLLFVCILTFRSIHHKYVYAAIKGMTKLYLI